MKGSKKIIFFLIFALCFFSVQIKKANAHFLSFEIIADDKRYVYFYPQIFYNEKGDSCLLDKEQIIKRIYLDLYVAPTNARLEFLPNAVKIFNLIPEKAGKAIDKSELDKKIELALFNGKNRVEIKSKPIKAPITVKEIEKQTFLRSTFSTFYGYSNENRKKNIFLATSFLNGLIIEPGESFSFNQVVGKRSEERGFLPAKIILEGKFIEGVGGGVCQVSTTIYNALLLAGLTPVESHNHSVRVDYVSPSFDAMVSDGLSDLKFKNELSFPVYIQGIANGQNLTFNVFGMQLECEYKLISKVIESLPAKTQIIHTSDPLLKNVTAKDGLKSEGYLYVYKQEKLILVKRLRRDIYKPIDGIIYLTEQTS